jgi:phosphatidylinositol alpha-1,6-mannosyltransferase
LLKKENIQYVHCAHVLSTGIVGLLLKQLTGVKYIVYTHSADVLQYQKNPIIKSLLVAILKQADKVVCNSLFTREKLLSLGTDPQKIRLIYPKTDPEKFESCDGVWLPSKFGLKKNKIILSVNRLVERKGNDTVIRAMVQVIKKVPDAVYVIGGHGPYRKQLESLVNELNLRDTVLFLGSVKNEDIGRLYKACDVFVMMSRNIRDEDVEGFGISFLEAGVCGKPVVGGNSGGIPEAVQDGLTGFLVDPHNVDVLADVLVRLLTDASLAAELGQNGQKRVRDQFDRRLLVDEVKILMSGA